jgi:hypothetical protein
MLAASLGDALRAALAAFGPNPVSRFRRSARLPLSQGGLRVNLRIWNALGKTDPKHTKGFSRAGGFKGTAIKPIWITQRLTELFGPCGVGWGFEKPEFQLVPTQPTTRSSIAPSPPGIIDGGKQHFIYGVGGDKVVAQRQSGPFCDDEAFKKAFTDALGNAFKFVGVGADVHMGLFEDSKYLAEVTAEFHPPQTTDGGNPTAKEKDGDYSPSALRGAIKTLVRNINGCASARELDELLELEDAKDTIEQCQRRFPAWWETGEGCPPSSRRSRN